MTPEMHRTLTTIRVFIATHGIAPSIREIMRAEGLKSSSATSRRVNRLVELGHLVRLPGRDRNIALPDVNLAPVPTEALRAELVRREVADHG